MSNLEDAPSDNKMATREHNIIGMQRLVWPRRNQAAVSIGMKQAAIDKQSRPRIIFIGVINITIIIINVFTKNAHAT